MSSSPNASNRAAPTADLVIASAGRSSRGSTRPGFAYDRADARRQSGGRGLGSAMALPYGEDAIAAAADPDHWELWSISSEQPETLFQRFPEFTCRCPRSGYPDFATVNLVSVPHERVLELKHLKLWLNGFRERTISHEQATAEILETLVSRLDLHYAFVLMEYTPRGNLTTFPMVERRHPRAFGLAPDDRLGQAIENALLVKRRLIDRVIAGV